MARRDNNNDWFNPLYELFTGYSAWLCIPIAILAFNLINGFLNWVAGNAPEFAGLAALTPIFGGSIAFVILAAGLKAGLEKLKRKSPFGRTANNGFIENLSESEFQLLINESYRRMGFEVLDLESKRPEGKIDLKLRDGTEITLVKCKYGNDCKIGVKPIRELHAAQIAERADRSIFVTGGIYTQRARSFVIGKQIELIDGEQLFHWIQPTAEQITLADSTAAMTTNHEKPDCPNRENSMLLQTVD